MVVEATLDVAPDLQGTHEIDYLIERWGYLQHLHQDQLAVRRRVKTIMNGGKAGLQALLGSMADDLGDDIIGPHLMQRGIAALGHKLGRMPTLKITPPKHADGEDQRDHAQKRVRIVTGYDMLDDVAGQLPQVGRWLPGYGFAVWILRTRETDEGVLYPQIELRDPFDCYPGWWGPNQQPQELAFAGMMPRDEMERQYPALKEARRYKAFETSPWSGVADLSTYASRGDWSSVGSDGYMYVEYHDVTGTYVFVPEHRMQLSFTPNPLSVPRFVVAKRFSFDRLRGQQDDSIGVFSMLVKYNMLEMIAVQDDVFAPTNIFGEMLSGERYQKGRNRQNKFEPSARVERPSHEVNFTITQTIDRLERDFRNTTGYSVFNDAESPNSFITGEGSRELKSSARAEEKEYQGVLARSLMRLDELRLRWDEEVLPDVLKPLPGQRKGQRWVENYKPSSHISGHWNDGERVHGAMADFDEPSKIVAGLQLNQAGGMSMYDLLMELDGVDDPELRLERVTGETFKKLLEDKLAQMAALEGAQGGPPTGPATLASIRIAEKPDDWLTIMKEFFTPQQPEMSPEDQAFLQPQDPLAALGIQQGDDAATVLSRLELNGGIAGGVQTVGQL